LIREIRHNEELVGRPEVRVEHSDGTYTSTIPIDLPSTTKKGTYTVISTVQTENVKDTKEVSFSVI
jgi:hypothetical protein